jgi:hypothetical protein
MPPPPVHAASPYDRTVNRQALPAMPAQQPAPNPDYVAALNPAPAAAPKPQVWPVP